MSEQEPSLTEAPEAAWSIGRYRVLQRVGEGAFAEVYFARDEDSLAPVALKVLRNDIDTSIREQVRVRFLAEERITKAIDHRYIVNIRETSPPDAQPCFLAMDFVSGRPFCEHLARFRSGVSGERPSRSEYLAEVARLGHQVAAAMTAAHAQGIVHRDLKPQNVLVTRASGPGLAEVRIVDFGIAKAPVELFGVAAASSVTKYWTELGTVMGSPPCMAPEQCGAAQTATGQADVYALGVMLFGSLLGVDIAALEQRSLHLELPDDLETSLELRGPLPPAWEQLLRSMLERSPEARPRMAEVALRLQRLSRTDEVFAAAVEAWVRGRRVPSARKLIRVLERANRSSALTDDEQRFIEQAPLQKLKTLRGRLLLGGTMGALGCAALIVLAVSVPPSRFPWVLAVQGGSVSDSPLPARLPSAKDAQVAAAALARRTKRIETLEGALDEQRKQASAHENELSQAQRQVEVLNGKFAKCRSRSDQLEGEVKQLETEASEQRAELERCDGESERLLACRQDIAAKSKELVEATQRLQICTKSLRGSPPTPELPEELELGMSLP